jgi:hypothetical protein
VGAKLAATGVLKNGPQAIKVSFGSMSLVQGGWGMNHSTVIPWEQTILFTNSLSCLGGEGLVCTYYLLGLLFAMCPLEQGDQIGQIFDSWVIAYCGQFLAKRGTSYSNVIY